MACKVKLEGWMVQNCYYHMAFINILIGDTDEEWQGARDAAGTGFITKKNVTDIGTKDT